MNRARSSGRLAGVGAVIVLSSVAWTEAVALQQHDLSATLSFELPELGGWSGAAQDTWGQDSVVVHGGRFSGRIMRPMGTDASLSTFLLSIPRTFAGETLELRGWLRTENVDGFAALWLREDGPGSPVQFDNMSGRSPRGTTGWAPYSISLPLDDDARTVVFGALFDGTGTLWVDDLELLVDGTPAWEAPEFVREPTPVELDTEFDGGSGIVARELTPPDVDRLALLGRIWGFAKYHHPRVHDGQVNWDYELFRVLPSVLEAPDDAAFRGTLLEWLDDLGEPPACAPCARPPAGDIHLEPRNDWITDRDVLGAALSERLQLIHARRPGEGDHYYVSHAPNVGNPVFSSEADYAELALPDAGYRLLALYRFWNMIEYWFPYRDLIGGDWNATLAEFVPRLMGPMDVEEYQLTLIELIARIEDTHANLWGSLGVRPPRGEHSLPIVLRFVEGRAVVTAFSHWELGPATGLRIGDIVEEIDGTPVADLVEAWRPYYSASNEPTRLRDIARKLTTGPPGTIRVSGERVAGPFTLEVERVHVTRTDQNVGRTHDLPGETFQHLSEDVAYIKLSSITRAMVPDYVERAKEAEILVIDIRNYPREFVVFELGGRLITEPTDFARFTVGDGANPGAFVFTPPISLQPLEPRFDGEVVVLVDEVSISQAEYTTMAFRAAPNTIVAGSTTAGADGNVSPIPLPGGVRSMISGIGVFYPDKTPTQQIGIIPDLEVRPTIAGIREGRDEVLEAAVSHALGREWRMPGR